MQLNSLTQSSADPSPPAHLVHPTRVALIAEGVAASAAATSLKVSAIASHRSTPAVAAAPIASSPIAPPAITFNINPSLTPEQTEKVRAVLLRNIDAFASHPVSPPPPAKGVEHAIHLINSAPIKQAPYRQSPSKQEFISETKLDG